SRRRCASCSWTAVSLATVFSGECRLADLIGVDHESQPAPRSTLGHLRFGYRRTRLDFGARQGERPGGKRDSGQQRSDPQQTAKHHASFGRNGKNVSLNRPLSGAECSASLPKTPARRSLRYDARLNEPRSPAFPKIPMANAPEVTNMALFCDFENVALGVQDAKYERFDIGKVLERLL